MKIRVFLAAILLSGAAQANCQWIDRPTADRALSIISDAPSVILGDRMAPESAVQIELVAAPSYTETWPGAPLFGLTVAHGRREIRFEQIYIQAADGAFMNLALAAGCENPLMPERLPEMPPVEEADRTGAPVPAISGPGIIGLVDLRSLYSNPEFPREQIPVRPATLYAAPDLSAPVHATIPDWDALPSDFMGYDFPAALVLERDRGWYRIAIFDGQTPPDEHWASWALNWYRYSWDSTAWLAPEDAGEFRSYEDLVKNNLAYLGGNWDGLLSVEPDPAARVLRLTPQWHRELLHPEQIDVEVRETRWIGARLWARVAVLWPGTCEGAAPLAIAEGWVPAHAAAGQPIVNFYASGC